MPTPPRLPRLPVALAAALLALPLALPLHAADGDLDPTFDGGAFTIGWGAEDVRATALEPIANGGLLVGGVVSEDGDVDGWVVVRLAADGTRVIGWDINFEVVSAGDETMATNGYLYDMRRDASDRTYLAGAADQGIDNEVPMLARLTPQGGLDDSFDGNGLLVMTDLPDAWEEVSTEAVEILADGRSVFVGTCTHCPLAEETWAWVIRRLPDGAPDTSFSGDGWHTFRFPSGEPYSNPDSVAIDSSGRIVVGGTDNAIDGDSWFARLTSSGNFDGSFGGGDGFAGPFAGRTVPALALDPATGRIASASRLAGNAYTGQVYVFTAAGVPDSTFSGNGHVDLNLETGTAIQALSFQSDGKLLAAGTINDNGANLSGFFLARMATDGALDDTFDDNGVKRVEFDLVPNAYDGAYALTTMGGRLVAAGLAGGDAGQEQEMAVVRTQNAQIFSDGFERGSTGAWPGF
jgi:uncharacterized delta-60 repeat protein